MVVVIQPRFGQLCALRAGQHTQSHAGFQPQRLHTFDHRQHIGKVFGRRILPCGSHTETGSTTCLRLLRFVQHPLHFHQLLFLEPGVVATTLRAILAIFWAGTGFDGEQCADLHFVRVKVFTVNCLRFEQQVIEWQGKQRFHFCHCPIVPDSTGDIFGGNGIIVSGVSCYGHVSLSDTARGVRKRVNIKNFKHLR